MRYNYQIYNILEIVAALNQQVVIHLIPTLTQFLKDSEQKWGLGRNITQRYVWLFDTWLHFFWAMIIKSRFCFLEMVYFPIPQNIVCYFEFKNVSVLWLTHPFTYYSCQSDHLGKQCISAMLSLLEAHSVFLIGKGTSGVLLCIKSMVANQPFEGHAWLTESTISCVSSEWCEWPS